MKKVGQESGKFEEGHPAEDFEPKDAKGKKWWHYINIDKMKPLLPTLRNPQGTKREVRYHTFLETWTACQELFERNRFIFRTRNQVDFLAHYIGTKILVEAWGQSGIPKSGLYTLLEKHERKRSLYDDMKNVKVIVIDLVEKFVEGFVTQEELDKRCEEFVDAFSTFKEKEMMAKIIDSLMETEELKKMKDRLRQRKHREQEKRLKGLESTSAK